MSRAMWFVAGAGAGVYAVVRARRLAEAFTPDGLGDRLAGLAVGMRLFAEEVRTGSAEKENEVRARFGVTSPGRPALTSTAPRTTDQTTEPSSEDDH